MSDHADLGFEDELLDRILLVAQQTIDRVAVGYRAGAVADVTSTLAIELDQRGINDLTDAWLDDVARRITAGESVTLPTAAQLRPAS